MLLLMKFFETSAWRNFHSIQLLESSNQKVFLSRLFGNLGIGISASASSLAKALQKNYFCHQNLKKKKSRIFVFFIVLSHGISTRYLVLCNFLFIKSKTSIGVLEKSYLNIWKHASWCFKKITATKISAYSTYFPAKHPKLSSF